MLYHYYFLTLLQKVPDNQEGLKLNGTHQLVVNAEDVTLLGKNKNTVTTTKKLYWMLVRHLV